MYPLVPLLLLQGCAQPFDHTEGVNLGPDPFLVDGSCTPRPLTTTNHDDGSVTTTETEALASSCRFSGSWQGVVLDLEDDVQSAIGTWARWVAIFWEDGEIDVTSASIRQDGGAWVDVRTHPVPDLTVSASITLFAEGAGRGAPAIQITSPAPTGGDVEVVDHDPLLTAVEDGWYGQEPRLPVMARADGVLEVDNEVLDAYSGSEIEINLWVDLTLSGTLCVFGHEPVAGSHSVEPGCGDPQR